MAKLDHLSLRPAAKARIGANVKVKLLMFAIAVALAPLWPAQAQGRFVTYRPFPSQFVAARQVDVWLPPGYDPESAVRFPVIYMHDGQNLFAPATSYTGIPWGVDRTMTRLIEEGKIRPAIIVGIWNTPKRIEEYMPQKATADVKSITIATLPPVPTSAILSDAYLKFVVTELKPFIDATFRTLPDRSNTFMMGSSMGALISAYALSEYPEVFGGAACLSPHWPAADGAVVTYLKSHLPDARTHKFYFDHGTKTLDADYAPFQKQMDAGMEASGYESGKNWITKVFEGADHSERSWSQRLDVPLLFLLGK